MKETRLLQISFLILVPTALVAQTRDPDAVIFPTNPRRSGNPDIPTNRNPQLRTLLPTVQPCSNGLKFCNEPDLYPSQKVMELFEQTVRNTPEEVFDKFFGPTSMAQFRNTDNINPACESSITFIPRYARAQNLKGKWKYLLQGTRGDTQHFQVTICSNPGRVCKTDRDSPFGPQTTHCRQLYKTQRLLAVDESGEVVVDSFDMPSECICYFTSSTSGLRFAVRDLISFGPTRNDAQCPNEEQSLKELSSVQQQNLAPRSFVQSRPPQRRRSRTTVSSCKDSTVCEADTVEYPTNTIRSVLNRNRVFGGKKSLFDSVFGPTCHGSDPGNEVAGNNVSVSVRTAFDLDQSALCKSFTKYIFPKKAQTATGEWRFIVNADGYEQGVTIETCLQRSEGDSCKYMGRDGHYVYATECKQKYSMHQMFALTEDGNDIYIDAFVIPSACICHIKDPSPFF